VLLIADTLRARRFGFGREAVRSSAADRVMAAAAAAHGGAVQVNGRMVDRPVLLQGDE